MQVAQGGFNAVVSRASWALVSPKRIFSFPIPAHNKNFIATDGAWAKNI